MAHAATIGVGDSESQKLGTALFLIEAMLKEIGAATSLKDLRDAEPMRRARKFLQAETSR